MGLSLIGAAVDHWLTPASEWTEIEPASAELNCSGDFVFLYHLGQSDMSAAAEKKKLTILYSELCERAVALFSAIGTESAEDGMQQLNERPNEDLTLDPALYRTLKDIDASGSRYPYLAPVFEQYGTLFGCTGDQEAVNFRPETNPDLQSFYDELLPYVNDPDAIRLVLNGDGTVRLFVSDEYAAFAKENAIEVYFDLFALKNAFIADYIAEELSAAGFTRGAISSYDGFIRCLDASGERFVLNGYAWKDGRAVQTGTQEYVGPMSIVTLRAFPVMEAKEHYWYRYEDGSVITALIDPKTGSFKPKADSVLRMDAEKSCGALAMEAYKEITE